MKTYQYNRNSYLFQVLFTGIFTIIIGIVAIGLTVSGVLQPLMILVAIVSAYNVWNTFVAKSTPETISISDDSISFESFGKLTSYKISELEKFKIREFPSSGKMYIRVNNHNMMNGRYWVQTKMFEDGKQLFKQLLDIEYNLHPNTIKARARRVNTEYLKKESEIKKGGRNVRKSKRRIN